MKKRKILLIGIIVALLAILGGLLVYLITTGKIKPSAEVAGPSLTLAPNSQTVSIGQTFNVRIVLDTANLHTSGVDIHHLHYDRAILEVQDSDPTKNGIQIQPGTIFPSYSLNLVDTTIGAIAMTGLVQDDDTTGIIVNNQTLATITFKALAEATTTTLYFDATPGNTADTGIIEPVTANDILASAPDGYVTVQSVVPPPPPPAAGHHHVCSSTEKVCTQVSGSGTNECTTDADCPEPPTEQPTVEPTPETAPTETPAATINRTKTPKPTPTSTPSTSPTFRSTFSPVPQLSPAPAAGGTITIFGHEMSKTTFILSIFVLAIVIVVIVFYIWQWRKKKDILGGPPEAGASDDGQI